MVLKEKNIGHKLFFINTHLDHVGKIARCESIALLLHRIEVLRHGLPVVFTGDFNATPDTEDFNATPDTEVFARVTQILHDSRTIAQKLNGVLGTFHDFGKITESVRPLIDYIFLTNDFIVKDYQTLPAKK